MSVGFANRWAAWRSKSVRPATSFTSQPEPRSIGIPSRGAQMKIGQFLLAGHLVEAPDTSIWDLPIPSALFEIELQGFHWLDHLAAEGTLEARQLAKSWFFEWVERFGNGSGPGWTPMLTGRRLLRTINHSPLLLMGEAKERQDVYFKAASQFAQFLVQRAEKESPGLPRIEALSGLIHASLSFDRLRKHLEPTMIALARECETVVDEKGEIPSRNAEDLMNIFTALAWVTHVVSEAGLKPERSHILAMERIVPVLRGLRLGDGGLGHFQGSGRGMEGRLDQALIDAAVRIPAAEDGGMGIHRIAQAGSILLVDKGKQITGGAAHFSPFAFEFSAGRVPLIMNSGPGDLFGEGWPAITRSPLAHSMSTVNDETPPVRPDKDGVLLVPTIETGKNADYAMFAGSHGAYATTHGLKTYRALELSADGLVLRGKDVVAAETDAEKSRANKWQKKKKARGIPWALRFHFNPDLKAEMGLKGKAVTLTSESGEIWVLTVEGGSVSLQKSAIMQYGRLRPRATKQAVVSARVHNYEGVIKWTLRKA